MCVGKTIAVCSEHIELQLLYLSGSSTGEDPAVYGVDRQYPHRLLDRR